MNNHTATTELPDELTLLRRRIQELKEALRSIDTDLEQKGNFQICYLMNDFSDLFYTEATQ